MNVKVSAVVTAAGKGTRMGFDKIFYQLLGKETILYSLEAMDENENIDETVLVVAKENKEKAEELIKGRFKKRVSVVCGGDSRTESVLNGILAASGEYVVIHDGARPLVSQKIITDCIENVKKYNAVTVFLPVTDTVKSFKGEFTEKTLDRDKMIAVQTPQCFKRSMYIECVEKSKNQSFTDDCALFEECGIPVRLVRGEERNIKLTKKTDIIIAEAFLRE